MSSLPKPRYPFRFAGRDLWPGSRIPPGSAKEVVPASSSLLDLQAQALVMPYEPEPVAPEPGVLAHLSLRWKQTERLLRQVGRWWMAADFSRCQLPILVLALGVWSVTARAAWQSQESATPFLRESMAKIREARAARATALNSGLGRAAGASFGAAATLPHAGSLAGSESVTRVSPATSAPVQRTAQKPGRSFPGVLLASVRSWFDPAPGAREQVQGNPRRRVWVDLKTGLYYCPHADYYGFGGRERGKVMLQRDAEYEYFQPATGAPCE